MSAIVPPSRPKATREEIARIANRALWPAAVPRVYVVGIRGYYKRTMGDPTKNDRGLYDDALVIVTPDTFAAFNANTDPSRQTPGIATLCPGVHPYRPGNHGLSKPGGGYPAFRPATPNEELPVMRDGQPRKTTGIALNIHKGGHTTTSSAGCQTIHPDQWDEFHGTLTRALAKAVQFQFPYILTEQP
jgi:lysozyme